MPEGLGSQHLERVRVAWTSEASGFLVGPAVFKTDVGATSSQAGSIPVRLRHMRPGPKGPNRRDEHRQDDPPGSGSSATISVEAVVIASAWYAAGCITTYDQATNETASP